MLNDRRIPLARGYLQKEYPLPALPCPPLPCPALPCPALPCPASAAQNQRFLTTHLGRVSSGDQKRVSSRLMRLQHLQCEHIFMIYTVPRGSERSE